MALRTTYGQVKDKIGLPIGMGGSHPSLLPLVNEASKLLWDEGDWIGKFQIYKIKVSQDCNGNRVITWPRQIETIEALQNCGSPIGVRNTAFEFIENGPGSFDSMNNPSNWWGYGSSGFGTGMRLLGDRAEVCTFVDVVPRNKKIKAYNSVVADNGTTITIYGYDDYNNEVRTLVGGVWQSGETLTLNATTPPITSSYFSVITGIQFGTNPRNGDVIITQVDTQNLNAETWLSTYAYDEEIPVYRRSILTGLPTLGNTIDTAQCQTVTAYVRMRYMPIAKDSDYLQIGNISALKDMLISLQKRDADKLQDAEIYRQRALRALNNELNQYRGVAPRKIMSFQKRALWGSSPNIQ